MSENLTKPVKMGPRALQAIRKAKSISSGGSFGLGGLPRKKKAAPINLRLPKEKR